MHNASFGDHMASWDRLATTVANNASELSHLQRTREELAQAQREAGEARQRQAAARAAAQQATRDLEAAIARAHEAATRLRSGLWGRYGRKSVRLIDFGMRPYRHARKRAAAPMQGGTLSQRVPETAPPVAAPDPGRGTFPTPAGRRSSMGRRSPSQRGNAAPAQRDSPQWGGVPQRQERITASAGTSVATISLPSERAANPPGGTDSPTPC